MCRNGISCEETAGRSSSAGLRDQASSALFLATKILMPIFLVGIFAQSIPFIVAAWLGFVIAFIPIYDHRCDACGAHVYRVNQKMEFSYPARGGWNFWRYGPDLQCPHQLTDRKG